MAKYYKPYFLFFFLLCLFNVSAQKKNVSYRMSGNTCGVIASFTPDKDSIFSNYTTITFTSTSTNASNVTWYLNDLPINFTSSFNFGFSYAGIYKIKLVAQNGLCEDSVIHYFVFTGFQPPNRDNIKAYYGFPAIEDYSTCFTSLKEGGYLMGGYTYNRKNGYSGLLIKTAESGCIEWTKLIEPVISAKVLKAIQLKDSSFASIIIYDNILCLVKLSKQGTLVWSKSFETTSPSFALDCIREAGDGGLIVTGNYWSNYMVVIRTDANGNVKWTKGYQKTGNLSSGYNVLDIIQEGNDIYISGYVSKFDLINGDTKVMASGILMKLADNTGRTIWTKKYSIKGVYLNLYDMHMTPKGIILNSLIDTSIKTPGNTFHLLDTSGTVLKSMTVSNPPTPNLTAATNILPVPGGDFYILNSGLEILPLQPGYANHSYFIKLDSSFNVKWAKHYGHYGSGNYFYSALGKKNSFTAVGEENGSTLPAYTSFSKKIQFIKLDSSGAGFSNLACDLSDVTIQVTPSVTTTESFTWDKDTVINTNVISYNMIINDAFAEVHYVCPTDFIDTCNFIKLKGPRDVCNLNDTLTYNVFRNKGCNEPVKWEVPAGVKIISQTDTALQIKLLSFNTYHISAMLPFTCSPVKDSLDVVAAPKGALYLNLGPDTSICPSNTIQLKAGYGFLTYKWNDGNTDSVLSTSIPGKYWVDVTDSCFNILSDTINITVASPVPLSIGPDRTKCNNDTLKLSGPSGFLNYSWSPVYNINSATAQEVIINPAKDTTYYIKAEKTPGCFGFDTIHIKVNTSPIINLGKDTSFCSGDSITLNAGAGFSSYVWNGNNGAQQLVAKQKGNYIIKAATAQGCSSSDTLTVQNVFANPVVQLNQDTVICTGSSKLLDPGTFATYLWNTGSTSKTITINSIGMYAVAVTDNNGCKGTDTSYLKKILPLPQQFLPGDTTICSYGDITLQALQNYNVYLWSDNSRSSSLKITKPGIYWLQVTDKYNCAGKDSVIVTLKDCMLGFYIPNTFTPNKDGHNDIFRPLVFGNIKQYRFAVYNRWGQIIYQSSVPGEGWNGWVNGSEEKTGIYAWTCLYQLEGETVINKKGTVTLIK